MDEARSKAVLFKLPPTLLEHLDVYAEKYCDGNRSRVIRQGIRSLLCAEEQEEEGLKGINQILPISSHKGNKSSNHGQE